MNAKPIAPEVLKSTHRSAWPLAVKGGELDRTREIVMTFWLEGSSSRFALEHALTIGSVPPRDRRYATADEVLRETAAQPDDWSALHGFCASRGFEIVETHWRSAVVRGSTGDMMDALAAEVELVSIDGRPFRMRVGSLHVPAELQGVRAALGLHQWPKSGAWRPPAPSAGAARAPVPTIAEVCERYGIPDADGSGETIAIIQLNGQFSGPDFVTAMEAQGLHAGTPIVRRVDDAALTHKVATTKDLESCVDTQIAGAFAPGARLVIYEAPNSERGLLDALRTAILDREYSPSIVSISFGFAEMVWTPVVLEIINELFAVAAMLGITIVCAAGDFGSAEENFLLAPASSPLALSCGATVVDEIGNESMWERSGGGFSTKFPVPAWQTDGAAVASALQMKPGRGTPDLSALMSFPIYTDGVALVSGGTSAVAPFVAAVIARINQRLGARCGFFAPLLHRADARQTCFRPIEKGSTGRFSVAAGWNPCSGLGAPKCDAIEALFT